MPNIGKYKYIVTNEVDGQLIIQGIFDAEERAQAYADMLMKEGYQKVHHRKVHYFPEEDFSNG